MSFYRLISLTVRRFVQSKPFKFLVGPDKCEFFIRPPLLAHYSRPLNALIQGPMKEANEQCAHLEEFDQETFARLTEFLYTGDYPAATHSIVTDSVQHRRSSLELELQDADPVQYFAHHGTQMHGMLYATDPDPEPELDEWGGFDVPQKKVKKGVTQLTKSEQAWKKFTLSCFSILAERTPYKLRPNQDPREEYTDVFLSHAKLYVFADMYDVEQLRKLSLYKLCRTLCIFTLHKERMGDIVHLLRAHLHEYT